MSDRTEYYLIPIKKITCDQPRSKYSEQTINDLAQNILATGVLLEPLVVARSGPQSYSLIEGVLNYYAAVRAQELSPRDAEMVSAFVVDPAQLDIAQSQLKIVKAAETQPYPTPTLTPIPTNGSSTELEKRVNNMEVRFDQSLRDLKAAYDKQFQALKEEVEDLQDNLPQKSEPLEMFNNLSEIELLQALRKAGIGQKMAQALTKNLVTARTEQPFKSYSDVVSRTQQLGDKRMLAILDSWSGF